MLRFHSGYEAFSGITAARSAQANAKQTVLLGSFYDTLANVVRMELLLQGTVSALF